MFDDLVAFVPTAQTVFNTTAALIALQQLWGVDNATGCSW